jgi:hypothetical protein
MSKKKEKSKKDKKKGGKAKLKAPDKKALQQEAIDLAIVRAATIWWVDPTDPQSIGDLKAAVERLTVERLPLASRPVSRDDEPIDVDFSTVNVTKAFRQRVYSQCKLTPRQKGTTSRVISEIMLAVVRARLTPSVPPVLDKAILVSGKSHERGIDLATLEKIASNQGAAAEVQALGSIGPVGLQYLQRFVGQAKQLVFADAQNTNAG